MMFTKLSTLAALVPFVSALTITTPTDWTSGGPATISWVTSAGDPSTWSFELVNPSFHNSFALANNVNPSLGSINITLPIVPVDNSYTLEAVNITDINNVFATTGSFAVGATISSTSSSASSTSSSVSSTSSSSTTSSSGSVSGFGLTLSSSSSVPAPSGGSSSSGSSTSSSSTVSPTSFNGSGNSNGATSAVGGVVGWISMMFAAAAGAVVAL